MDTNNNRSLAATMDFFCWCKYIFTFYILLKLYENKAQRENDENEVRSNKVLKQCSNIFGSNNRIVNNNSIIELIYK